MREGRRNIKYRDIIVGLGSYTRMLFMNFPEIRNLVVVFYGLL